MSIEKALYLLRHKAFAMDCGAKKDTPFFNDRRKNSAIILQVIIIRHEINEGILYFSPKMLKIPMPIQYVRFRQIKSSCSVRTH